MRYGKRERETERERDREREKCIEKGGERERRERYKGWEREIYREGRGERNI